jgi:hypothetical protein
MVSVCPVDLPPVILQKHCQLRRGQEHFAIAGRGPGEARVRHRSEEPVPVLRPPLTCAAIGHRDGGFPSFQQHRWPFNGMTILFHRSGIPAIRQQPGGSHLR